MVTELGVSAVSQSPEKTHLQARDQSLMYSCCNFQYWSTMLVGPTWVALEEGGIGSIHYLKIQSCGFFDFNF